LVSGLKKWLLDPAFLLDGVLSLRFLVGCGLNFDIAGRMLGIFDDA
jgi:hypothetical protein